MSATGEFALNQSGKTINVLLYGFYNCNFKIESSCPEEYLDVGIYPGVCFVLDKFICGHDRHKQLVP